MGGWSTGFGWLVSSLVDTKTTSHPTPPLVQSIIRSGIVIKHEGVEYKRAVHFAQLVLDLLAKSKSAVKGVLDAMDVRACYLLGGSAFCVSDWILNPPRMIDYHFAIQSSKPAIHKQNEMESLRLKTREYELLAGQSGSYTLVVIQQGQLPFSATQQQPSSHQGYLSSSAPAKSAEGGTNKEAK